MAAVGQARGLGPGEHLPAVHIDEVPVTGPDAVRHEVPRDDALGRLALARPRLGACPEGL